MAITSGGINTLEIYRRWNIPEVWIWRQDALEVYVLEKKGYTKSQQSRWFPNLDLPFLAECAKMENTLEACKTFLAKAEV